MNQYWNLNQTELATYLNYSGEIQCCTPLNAIFHCFLKSYKFIPNLNQWLHYCKLNSHNLLKLDSEISNFTTHQESLLEVENSINKICGINISLTLSQSLCVNISHPREALYASQILNLLHNHNDFIFICFYYKNASADADLSQGAHCVSLYNHSGSIILYDPNLGISNLGNSNNKKELKQEIHRFFSIYSESYLHKLINNHLNRHSKKLDSYKLKKWQWRYGNLNNSLKRSPEERGYSDIVLYFSSASLSGIGSSQTFTKEIFPKLTETEIKKDINNLKQINYFNHYDNLKYSKLWDIKK